MMGGCLAPNYVPGRMPPPPPGYLPEPWFLEQVCCAASSQCCPEDEKAAPYVKYDCCGSDKPFCAIDGDGKGVCGTNATTPYNQPSGFLDGLGRCPAGEFPLTVAPQQPWKCSTNANIANADCPTNHICAKDNSNNANSGVCCRSSGCDTFTNCTGCASADAVDNKRRGCSWLTQGDLYNPMGRCVETCQNFPSASCIIGGLTASTASDRCPLSPSNPNGTQFNTGSCERRCGLIGTGRSSRINNGTNPVIWQYDAEQVGTAGLSSTVPAFNNTYSGVSPTACRDMCDQMYSCEGYSIGVTGGGGGFSPETTDCAIYTGSPLVVPGPVWAGKDAVLTWVKNGSMYEPTACCKDYPGDYCCNAWGQVQTNCAWGAQAGGPKCGVPIRGTPWTLSAPPPPPQQPYYPPFGPARPPFPPTYVFRPPMFWRDTVNSDKGYNDKSDRDSKALAKWYLFPPYMPPPFPPPPPPRPPPPPPPPPQPIDQFPSQFVCSCDPECRHKYNDCCDDFASYCCGVNNTC